MSEIGTPEPVLPDALDLQHDPFPVQEDGKARRIPHLGHLALLLGMLAVAALVCTAGYALLVRNHPGLRNNAVLEIGLEAAIYIVTLAEAWKIFPLLWKRSFLDGLEFNLLAARRQWPRLVAAGLALCVLAQLPDRFIHQPEHPDIEKLMSTPAGAWSALALGVLLAPLCEEIVFRGFLLPALATAYDWLSLDRTPAGLERWHNTTTHSTGAKIFGALLSSLAFAVLHAPQNHYAWGLVAVLFFVGLALAFVRLRTHSVACSTLVHMTYNGALFAAMVIITHGFRHMEKLNT